MNPGTNTSGEELKSAVSQIQKVEVEEKNRNHLTRPPSPKKKKKPTNKRDLRGQSDGGEEKKKKQQGQEGKTVAWGEEHYLPARRPPTKRHIGKGEE